MVVCWFEIMVFMTMLCYALLLDTNLQIIFMYVKMEQELTISQRVKIIAFIISLFLFLLNSPMNSKQSASYNVLSFISWWSEEMCFDWQKQKHFVVFWNCLTKYNLCRNLSKIFTVLLTTFSPLFFSVCQ